MIFLLKLDTCILIHKASNSDQTWMFWKGRVGRKLGLWILKTRNQIRSEETKCCISFKCSIQTGVLVGTLSFFFLWLWSVNVSDGGQLPSAICHHIPPSYSDCSSSGYEWKLSLGMTDCRLNGFVDILETDHIGSKAPKVDFICTIEGKCVQRGWASLLLESPPSWFQSHPEAHNRSVTLANALWMES